MSRPQAECTDRIVSLVSGCADVVGVPFAVSAENVTVLDEYLGPGYGKPSPQGSAAGRLAAELEGLVLDQTFTAKAMAALVSEARASKVGGPVVFLHTGGLGGILGSGSP